MDEGQEEDQVAIYESDANHNKDGLHVLFGDGRVQWKDQCEALRILSKLNSGQSPPRSPAAASRP